MISHAYTTNLSAEKQNATRDLLSNTVERLVAMTLSVEVDRTTKRILAVYFQLAEGQVARTVEIEEDACYADEDSGGQLMGVEILVPEELATLRKKVAEHYHSTEIDDLLEQAKLAFV